MRGARFLDFPRAVIKRFYADHCLVRASALAYASLLSIVPLLAVMFAVLKGLGVQWRLEPLLLSRLSLDADTIHAVISYIDRTNVKTLGALGAATLVFSVISVLGSIEGSFNYIWRVSRSRSIWRKVTDYVSVVMLTPFLMLAAVAITSSLHVRQTLEWVAHTELVGKAVLLGLRIAPALINAAALGILYSVMPNRRPSLRAVAVSAVVAGLAWHVVQWGYVSLQIGAARYNAIYGALSQLPVTLVWLYVSWVIVLAGAELAVVVEFGADVVTAEHWNTAAVMLHVMLRAAESFRGDRPALNVRRLADELRVDVDTINHAIDQLVRRGWLVAVDSGASRYMLARDPSQIELTGLGEIVQLVTVPRGCDPRVGRVLQEVAKNEAQAWSRWRLADVLAQTPGADNPESTRSS